MEFDIFLDLLRQTEEHITVLNHNSTAMATDIAVLETQMSEILIWGRAIGFAIVGLLAERFFNIVTTYKKNGNGNGKKK